MTLAALSVLIPIRNAEGTLEEALSSVAGQTFAGWEAILVDDGSTDRTPALLEAWVRRDRRFRLLRQPRNLGIAAALNRALEEASAPIVARMDADDIALPERFERQLARLARGDAAAVGCGVRYFPDPCVGEGARRYEAWLNSLVEPEDHDRDLFVECPIAHPTLMLHATAIRAVGGYRDMGWPEDYDLCLRLWAAGFRMAKAPEVLLAWREGGSRASRTRPEYTRAAFDRCKAHFLARTCLAGGRPALLFGAGPTGKAVARALLAEDVRLAAFVDVDPRKVGQSIYGIPVLPQSEGFDLRGRAFGLAAVGRPESRALLRAQLREAGWREPEEFRCVS